METAPGVRLPCSGGPALSLVLVLRLFFPFDHSRVLSFQLIHLPPVVHYYPGMRFYPCIRQHNNGIFFFFFFLKNSIKQASIRHGATFPGASHPPPHRTSVPLEQHAATSSHPTATTARGIPIVSAIVQLDLWLWTKTVT